MCAVQHGCLHTRTRSFSSVSKSDNAPTHRGGDNSGDYCPIYLCFATFFVILLDLICKPNYMVYPDFLGGGNFPRVSKLFFVFFLPALLFTQGFLEKLGLHHFPIGRTPRTLNGYPALHRPRDDIPLNSETSLYLSHSELSCHLNPFPLPIYNGYRDASNNQHSTIVLREKQAS